MKIIDSIRTRPINLILILCVIPLYFFNNMYLKSITTGEVQLFFICYFNDLICPLFFLSYSNLLLLTVQKEIHKLKWLLLFCLSAGLIWEYGAPIIKRTSITDITDLLCYLSGGIIYWIMLKINMLFNS